MLEGVCVCVIIPSLEHGAVKRGVGCHTPSNYCNMYSLFAFYAAELAK